MALSSWRIIIILSLLLMIVQGNGARKLTETRWNDLQHHELSEFQLVDPAMKHVFFTANNLKLGNRLQIFFPSQDPSRIPRFLSRRQSNSVPFSSKHLPYLLQLFSIPKNSLQAKAVEFTLSECELEPLKGETKSCPTSLESMLDFASNVFGFDIPIEVVTTNHLTKPKKHLQNYTIIEQPKQIVTTKMVGCHTMPYPYVVYYCHSQEGGDKLYEVSLVGDNGEKVKAVAVCHLDTSQWDPDCISFSALRTKPGASTICHFLPADNMIWMPSTA